MEPATQPPFDVAIIGGGPAGLTAALVLGRMRRRVLLLDADDPAHGVSDAVHGLVGHDGTPPLELRRIAREQLRPYETVTVRMAAAEEVRVSPAGFSVVASGMTSEAGILLLATGMRYELPPIEGAAELWGKGVYHCPYCHGWELRDRPVAAYGSGAAHLARILTSLSDDVALLADGNADLDRAEAEQLRQLGVTLLDAPIARLEAEDRMLARVVFGDGTSDERAGLFFVPSFTPSPLPARLGCELDDSGAIVIDEEGRTSVPGAYAAGDGTTDKKAVVLAAAAGSRAAYSINAGIAGGVLPLADGNEART